MHRTETSAAVELVAVDTTAWLRSVSLDWDHRDPADRVIVATALLKGTPRAHEGRIRSTRSDHGGGGDQQGRTRYIPTMGTVHVTARVRSIGGSKKYFDAEFLVDTGAINCMAPASSLKKIGVRAESREVYELANGETVEYPVGFARVSFLGSETVTRVIFGPEGVEPLIGVVALEDMGIGVDPVSRTLRRMTAKPLK